MVRIEAFSVFGGSSLLIGVDCFQLGKIMEIHGLANPKVSYVAVFREAICSFICNFFDFGWMSFELFFFILGLLIYFGKMNELVKAMLEESGKFVFWFIELSCLTSSFCF